MVAKPQGVLTVPPPAKDRRGKLGEPALGELLRAMGINADPVHRLDREASGAVICAKDEAARRELMDAFKTRGVRKTYLAIVSGRLRNRSGVLRFPIKDLGADAMVAPDGQPAETRYRTVKFLGPATLVEVDLVTGRHNQIRLHFARIGHPLVGERKYARGREQPVRHKRVALHGSKLVFVPPGAGGPVEVEAPMPVDLRNLISKLEALGG